MIPGIKKRSVQRKIQRICHDTASIARAQLLKPSMKSLKLTGSGERDILRYTLIEATERIASTIV